jgi:tape measure domain-containing protein
MAAKIEVILSVIDRGTKEIHRFEGNVRRFAANASKAMSTVFNLPNLVAGYGLYRVGKGLYDIQVQAEAMRNKLQAALPDARMFGDAMSFVRQEASRVGTNLATVTDSFSGFTAAATRTGFTLGETKVMFQDINNVTKSLKLSGDRTGMVFMALEQMASKGVVSMEELRRQLSDHLPGALAIAAKSMGMTSREFQNAVKNGEIMARDFLPKFTKQLREDLGGGFEAAADSIESRMARIHNAMILNGQTITEKLVPAFVKLQEIIMDTIVGWQFIFEGKSATELSPTTKRLAELGNELMAIRTHIEGLKKNGLTQAILGYQNGQATVMTLDQLIEKEKEIMAESKKIVDTQKELNGLRIGGAGGGDDGKNKIGKTADELERINDRIAGRMTKLRDELAAVNLEIETDQLEHDRHIVDILVKRASEVGWAQEQMTEQERRGAEERQRIAEQEYAMKRNIMTSMISLGEQLASVAIGSMFTGDGENEKKQAKKRAVAYFAIANMAAAASIWTDQKSTVYEKIGESIGVGAGLTGNLIASLATVDKYARGTRSARGGAAWVGEQGPEMVNLPRGAQVYSAQESRGMGMSGAPTFNLTINGPVDQSTLPAIKNDLQAFGKKMMDAIRYGGADLKRAMAYPT